MVVKKIKKLAKKAITPKTNIDPRGTGHGALSKQEWEGVQKRIRELDAEFKKKKKKR